MCHVSFYSFHKVWNKIIAPFKLNIDLAIAIFKAIAAGDEGLARPRSRKMKEREGDEQRK